MPNTMKNVGGVTKEIVTQIFNESSILKGIQRKYSDQFEKDGAKIGNILNVKYLDNLPVTRGRTISISPVVERTIPITLLDVHQYQSAFGFNSADYSLSVESFTEKTNLKQIARKMANEMESDCARLFAQFPMSVGTVGTTPGTAAGAGLLMSTSPNIYTNASGVMTSYGAPSEDRTMAINPQASGLSIAALAGLQNPVSEISSQYRKGRMGANTLGFDFIENVNLPSFTTGTRLQAAATVSVPSLDGATTLAVTGLGAGATVMIGEHFTVAGVRMVNPMSQLQQGYLQQFTVTANAVADAGGNATLSISPAIVLANPEILVGTTMVRMYPALPVNVNGTVDALPLGGAAITFMGAPSTTGVFNCGFQKDSIVMTSVDLPVYAGTDKCSQQNFEGFSARVWRDSDITNDRVICRIDSMVVFTMIRKEYGIVVWG